MARTKATARKTTGGKAPSKKNPMPPPESDSESDSSSSIVPVPVKKAPAAKKAASKKTETAVSKKTETAASKKAETTAKKAETAAKKAPATKKAAASKKTLPPPEDSDSESDSQSIGSSSESVTQSHSSDDASSSSSSSSEVILAPPKKGADKKVASKKAAAKEVDPPMKKKGGSKVAPPPLSESDSDSDSSSSDAPPPKKATAASKKDQKEKVKDAKPENVEEEISYYVSQADLFKILFAGKKPDAKIVKALAPFIFTPTATEVTTVKYNPELRAYVAEGFVFDPETQTVFARLSSANKIVPLTSKDESAVKVFNRYNPSKSTYPDEAEIKTLLAASQAFYEKVIGRKAAAKASAKKMWGDESGSEGGDDGVIIDPIDRTTSENSRTRNAPPKITKEIFSKFVVAQRTPDVNRVDASAIASVAGITEEESREILSKYALYAKEFPAALASAVASDRGRPSQPPSADRGRGNAPTSGFNQRRSNSAGPSTSGGGRQFSNAARGGGRL